MKTTKTDGTNTYIFFDGKSSNKIVLSYSHNVFTNQIKILVPFVENNNIKYNPQ